MTHNMERAQVGWGFWLWWVLATAVSLGVGFGVGLAVALPMAGALAGTVGGIMGSVIGSAMGSAVAGAVVGIAQWLVLRRQVARLGWWVLASIVGFVVGGAVGGAVASAVGLTAGSAVTLALSGASVGIAQWLVLRRQVSRAGWWVLASIVGGALLVTWAGYGAITGGVLFWLLRQPVSEEPSLPQGAA